GTDRQRGIEATGKTRVVGATGRPPRHQPETGINMKITYITVAPPDPKPTAVVEKDQRYTAPAYGRVFPVVVKEGRGMVIEDVDGNLFLDFMAGARGGSTGQSHPQ